MCEERLNRYVGNEWADCEWKGQYFNDSADLSNYLRDCVDIRLRVWQSVGMISESIMRNETEFTPLAGVPDGLPGSSRFTTLASGDIESESNMTQDAATKINWWSKLEAVGLEYGKQITRDNGTGLLALDGCPRQFATAREIFTYAAERFCFSPEGQRQQSAIKPAARRNREKDTKMKSLNQLIEHAGIAVAHVKRGLWRVYVDQTAHRDFPSRRAMMSFLHDWWKNGWQN